MRAYEFITEHDTILEEPVPSDWDETVFTPKTSYKKRSEYASERAPKIGKGSARTAFDIPYDDDKQSSNGPSTGTINNMSTDNPPTGDRTIVNKRSSVLKIAHNKKGAAQNQAEVDILNDGYLKSLNIAIPLIDYDKNNDEPTWLQTERAKKATNKTLCSLMKCPTLNILIQFAQDTANGKNVDGIRRSLTNTLSTDDLNTFLSYSNKLAELQNSFNIELDDFRRPDNWGIYNGLPCVTDLGFTEEVKQKHYGNKKK